MEAQVKSLIPGFLVWRGGLEAELGQFWGREFERRGAFPLFVGRGLAKVRLKFDDGCR
jgi:hypothetical protein